MYYSVLDKKKQFNFRMCLLKKKNITIVFLEGFVFENFKSFPFKNKCEKKYINPEVITNFKNIFLVHKY